MTEVFCYYVHCEGLQKILTFKMINFFEGIKAQTGIWFINIAANCSLLVQYVYMQKYFFATAQYATSKARWIWRKKLFLNWIRHGQNGQKQKQAD